MAAALARFAGCRCFIDTAGLRRPPPRSRPRARPMRSPSIRTGPSGSLPARVAPRMSVTNDPRGVRSIVGPASGRGDPRPCTGPRGHDIASMIRLVVNHLGIRSALASVARMHRHRIDEALSSSDRPRCNQCVLRSFCRGSSPSTLDDHRTDDAGVPRRNRTLRSIPLPVHPAARIPTPDHVVPPGAPGRDRLEQAAGRHSDLPPR